MTKLTRKMIDTPKNLGKCARDRFWEYVIKSDACWIWNGYKNQRGYGYIKVIGKFIQTHRMSWVMHYGDIPEGLCVLHKCDNPSCVRPDHLFIGTFHDNTLDAMKKGRICKGEQVGISKLKEWQVLKIRSLYLEGISITNIAKRFAMSRAETSKIIHRNVWKHI